MGSAVVGAACTILATNTVKNPDNRAKVSSWPRIRAVVAAMQNHPDSTAVQEGACKILANITLKNAANREKVGDAGGIAAVVAAMRMYPVSAGIQEALRGSCRYYDEERGEPSQSHCSGQHSCRQSCRSRTSRQHPGAGSSSCSVAAS